MVALTAVIPLRECILYWVLTACLSLSLSHGQCHARPTVNFPATEHHRPLVGTKLYCLLTEAHVYMYVCVCVCVCVNNLLEVAAQDGYIEVEGTGVEPVHQHSGAT